MRSVTGVSPGPKTSAAASGEPVAAAWLAKRPLDTATPAPLKKSRRVKGPFVAGFRDLSFFRFMVHSLIALTKSRYCEQQTFRSADAFVNERRLETKCVIITLVLRSQAQLSSAARPATTFRWKVFA